MPRFSFYLDVYFIWDVCVFFISNFLQSSSAKDYLTKSCLFFFLIIIFDDSECKKNLAEFSETDGELPGKDACPLCSRPRKVSLERGFRLDLIFVQWLHLNIQLLSWQSLP